MLTAECDCGDHAELNVEEQDAEEGHSPAEQIHAACEERINNRPVKSAERELMKVRQQQRTANKRQEMQVHSVAETRKTIQCYACVRTCAFHAPELGHNPPINHHQSVKEESHHKMR